MPTTLYLSLIVGMLFVASERALVWTRHSSKVPGSRPKDRGTIHVLWLTALLANGAALLVAILRLGPQLPEVGYWWMPSLVFFGLGTALRWWAIIHLGHFFTVDITVQESHRVVDDGPYRYVRHPSYTGLLLQFIGWSLTVNRVLAVPVVAIPVLAALIVRIRAEEGVLREALGEAYGAYCRRTKRLIPWIY